VSPGARSAVLLAITSVTCAACATACRLDELGSGDTSDDDASVEDAALGGDGARDGSARDGASGDASLGDAGSDTRLGTDGDAATPQDALDADDGASAVDATDAAPPPIAYVHGATAGWNGQASVSTGITLTAGNFVVVAVAWAGATPATLSDTLGNTWYGTAATPATSCSPTAQIWYAQNAKGGADTITATSAGSTAVTFCVGEYSGIAATTALEAQATRAAPASSNAMSVAAMSTSAPQSLAVAYFADLKGTGTMVVGAGYTGRQLDTQFYSLYEDVLGLAPGSYAPGAALPVGTNDDCWVGAAAAFRAP
jgi:hypothetical protein